MACRGHDDVGRILLHASKLRDPEGLDQPRKPPHLGGVNPVFDFRVLGDPEFLGGPFLDNPLTYPGILARYLFCQLLA